MSIADELEKLANLRDNGALTEDKFQRQKAKFLGKNTPYTTEQKMKRTSRKSIIALVTFIPALAIGWHLGYTPTTPKFNTQPSCDAAKANAHEAMFQLFMSNGDVNSLRAAAKGQSQGNDSVYYALERIIDRANAQYNLLESKTEYKEPTDKFAEAQYDQCMNDEKIVERNKRENEDYQRRQAQAQQAAQQPTIPQEDMVLEYAETVTRDFPKSPNCDAYKDMIYRQAGSSTPVNINIRQIDHILETAHKYQCI